MNYLPISLGRIDSNHPWHVFPVGAKASTTADDHPAICGVSAVDMTGFQSGWRIQADTNVMGCFEFKYPGAAGDVIQFQLCPICVHALVRRIQARGFAPWTPAELSDNSGGGSLSIYTADGKLITGMPLLDFTMDPKTSGIVEKAVDDLFKDILAKEPVTGHFKLPCSMAFNEPTVDVFRIHVRSWKDGLDTIVRDRRTQESVDELLGVEA